MISVHHRSKSYESYRAERVKSLFNAEGHGERFDLDIDADVDSQAWNIGVVVGPSGSGKTSIARELWGEPVNLAADWPGDAPIIDAILPHKITGAFDEITAALSAVGLGSVPGWLRPFHLLSNGEQFRAALARLLLEPPAAVSVVDEFTSVVDRVVAKIGAAAFAKAWRRKHPDRQFVALSPHYDILDWLEPDWVMDTKQKTFTRGRLRRRPKIELEIRRADGKMWRYFKPHYYLDLHYPVAAQYFIGWVGDEPVAHLAIAPFFQVGYYRATRLVVMPEWQGAGLGTRFLDAICQWHLEGNGRGGHKFPTIFHTSHPQLAAALRRNPRWIQKSLTLFGGKCNTKTMGEALSRLKGGPVKPGTQGKYGGHLRAVQGFGYFGEGANG